MRQIVSALVIMVSANFIVSAQYLFTPETTLRCTSTKNQQLTGTCWSFSTVSFLESELLRQGGKEVNLSEMYVVREIYMDKAQNYLLRQGKASFGDGGLSHDVIHAVASHGIVPESVYPGLKNEDGLYDHTELLTVLKACLDAMIDHHTVSEHWRDVVNALLDIYIGPVPSAFQVDGKTLTPEQYEKKLGFDTDAYVSITSFTHHPFYSKFVLEIPDNFANGSYYNVPLDDLVRTVHNALEKGYTVVWDGDVSEKTFNAEYGIAIMPLHVQPDVFTHPVAERQITQSDRQVAFEELNTTDDHLMHIIGIAEDQNKTPYFIVKNSWGPIGPYQGYIYMSEPYFRSKTIGIMVHRDAVPEDIMAHFPK